MRIVTGREDRQEFYCEECLAGVAGVAARPTDEPFFYGPCQCPEWSAVGNPELAKQLAAFEAEPSFTVFPAVHA